MDARRTLRTAPIARPGPLPTSCALCQSTQLDQLPSGLKMTEPFQAANLLTGAAGVRSDRSSLCKISAKSELAVGACGDGVVEQLLELEL